LQVIEIGIRAGGRRALQECVDAFDGDRGDRCDQHSRCLQKLSA
jgi:hypothetical protein